ncbi:VanZ family protein [Evansella sp. AB-rgal1]|uniref:VanZ family protein n=1 Tax=Evansella sp. AB-rgal1 TaxID=3242696 RepID=UPI00359E264F
MIKYLSWVAVFLWMLLIFHFSHQPANVSSELSGGVTDVIVNAVEKVIPIQEVDVSNLNHMVRKNAHFFIYFVLGFLVIHALRQGKVRGKWGIVFAMVICILYAISDEVHQIFIPGRSGEIRDVLIDTVGSTFGIGLYLLLNLINTKRSRQKDKLAA